MHGEELAASRALDQVQEQQAPCNLVFDVTCRMHLFLRQSGLDRCCTFRLWIHGLWFPRASMRPGSTHSRSAAAVHPVPYVYDVSRLASVCFYANLWYTHL